MTSFETLRDSLSAPAPPADLPLALRALWWAGRDDWTRAHDCAQQGEGAPDCDWVHAYLHRVEGDAANAGYWYRRAGRTASLAPVGEEWTTIARALCARSAL